MNAFFLFSEGWCMLDVGSSPEKKFPRKIKKKNYFLAIGPSIYGLTACLPFCLCIDVG